MQLSYRFHYWNWKLNTWVTNNDKRNAIFLSAKAFLLLQKCINGTLYLNTSNRKWNKTILPVSLLAAQFDGHISWCASFAYFIPTTIIIKLQLHKWIFVGKNQTIVILFQITSFPNCNSSHKLNPKLRRKKTNKQTKTWWNEQKRFLQRRKRYFRAIKKKHISPSFPAVFNLRAGLA